MLTRRAFLAGTLSALSLVPTTACSPKDPNIADDGPAIEVIADEETPLAQSPGINTTNILAKGFESLESSVDLSPYHLTKDDVRKGYNALKRSYPCLFYANGLTIGAASSSGFVNEATLEYLWNGSELALAIESYEQAVNEIMAKVNAADDEASLARTFHDFLVNHCEYDPEIKAGARTTTDSYERTAYGALVNRIAVCEGYAHAYKDLLSRVGIPSLVIESEEMNHSWNIICIAGSWFHVDVTNDDNDNGLISRAFFLKSDNYMRAHGHYGWECGIACADTRYDA